MQQYLGGVFAASAAVHRACVYRVSVCVDVMQCLNLNAHFDRCLLVLLSARSRCRTGCSFTARHVTLRASLAMKSPIIKAAEMFDYMYTQPVPIHIKQQTFRCWHQPQSNSTRVEVFAN